MTRPGDHANDQQTAFLAFLDQRILEKRQAMTRYLVTSNLRPMLKAEVAELEMVREVFMHVYNIRERSR